MIQSCETHCAQELNPGHKSYTTQSQHTAPGPLNGDLSCEISTNSNRPPQGFQNQPGLVQEDHADGTTTRFKTQKARNQRFPTLDGASKIAGSVQRAHAFVQKTVHSPRDVCTAPPSKNQA
jgi:hypothetical protein